MQIPLKKKTAKQPKPKSRPLKRSRPQSLSTLPSSASVALIYELAVKDSHCSPQQRLIEYCTQAALLLGVVQLIAALILYLSERQFWNDWLLYSGIACLIACFVLAAMNSPKTQKISFSRDFCAVGGMALAWPDLRVRLRLRNALGMQVTLPEQAATVEIWIKLPDLQERRFELLDVAQQIEPLKKMLFCAPAGSLPVFSAADHAQLQQQATEIFTAHGVIRMRTHIHSEILALYLLGCIFLGLLFGGLLYLCIAPWLNTDYANFVGAGLLMLGMLAGAVWTDFHFYMDEVQFNPQGLHSKRHGAVNWAQIVNVALHQSSDFSDVVLTVREADGAERQLRWKSAFNQFKAEQFAKICQSHASLAYA